MPLEARRLARNLFRAVMKRHRRSALHRLNMVVDQRIGTVTPAHMASDFRMSARLSTLDKGKSVNLLLQTYPSFTTRSGAREQTVQVNQRSDGSFDIGVLTVVTETFAASRYAQQPRCEALALALGLNMMSPTDQSGPDWPGVALETRIPSSSHHDTGPVPPETRPETCSAPGNRRYVADARLA